MDASVKSMQSGSANTAGPFLRIRALAKRFGAFTALKDIDLDVAKGEFVCFLGPSGCGKTTLLRAIAGLDPQDEGLIEIAGRDVSNLPPAARDFGIVFQSYALFPNLTVAANVGYGLVNRRAGRAAMDARVKELLALVGLPEQGTKYPGQLSGGQQQRVALARALATSPGLLLLDEPLSALDARVRVRLREEIKQLQRRLGVTTIMVTHDQEEALAMADRIVVMREGVIEQVGTPSEIYRKPATAFVADFVGTMTFLDAQVSGPDRLRFGTIELACNSINGFAHGAAVRIGLRPEEIRVRNIDAATPNRIDARVSLLDFLGAFCRARLEPEAAPGVAILADFSANLMRDLSVVEGQTLTIALPPESLRVFAKS
ncbi:MAG: putative 2-aminoethylphosphonate ABC transporter ATP-binding protein [Alphaproteobacteria bacterium]|nr:MAG: putative 2-aminoethylphosphonate ABC transporter ATP-binding protein [Alphaproteobacteria bacterium]